MAEQKDHYKIIIVGGGMAGAVIAGELSKKTKDILLIERGGDKPKKADPSLKLTKESTLLISYSGLGGTTRIFSGNAVKILPKELETIGIDLGKEYSELENEIGIEEIDPAKYGERTSLLIEAGEKLGYRPVPSIKFTNFKINNLLDSLAVDLGIKNRSVTWDARRLLKKIDIDVLCGHEVKSVMREEKFLDKVLRKRNRVAGVIVKDQLGERSIISEIVVLAAGVINTTRILLNSGITEDKESVSLGLSQSIYGAFNNLEFNEEIKCPVSFSRGQKDEITLSPCLLPDLPFVKASRAIGLTVAFRDEHNGRINKIGGVSKPVNTEDLARLDEGIEISTRILLKMGIDIDKLHISYPVVGFAPLGSFLADKIVDEKFETKIENLYVGDSSLVSPENAVNPSFMIGALAKRLAKNIVREHL